MGNAQEQLIKKREVRFCPLHPDASQARSAASILGELDGVLEVQSVAEHVLHVKYDVTRITLELIESALADLGFHLDASLLSKLRSALYYFTEENERANLGIDRDAGAATRLFIDRYQRRRHGCRDIRPPHWRNYL